VPTITLFAEHELQVDAVRGHLDRAIAARNARKHQHAVLAQGLHAVEHDG
jgi:hypothetical protein